MNLPKALAACFAGALAVSLLGTAMAPAASSFSNSLTGFTGNSTLVDTQTALADAGFSFYSTAGLDDEFLMDPTVGFDENGATFGILFAGDGGRNYIRTNDDDYATVSFVAEITIERLDNGQQVFFGLGAGDSALFGVPDWSTLNSSTFVTPEDGSLTTWRSSNDANEWSEGPSVSAAGTHRLRMEFDPDAKTMIYSIDLDYTGGDFTADATAPTVDLEHIDCPEGCGDPPMPISADFFGEDGWPNEPSRIYFGGDDEAIFRDFSVTVLAAALAGDFNGSGAVENADLTLLLNNWGAEVPPAPAGWVGSPLTAPAVDNDELTALLNNWGNSLPGGGSSAVPEPATWLLALGALGLVQLFRHRGRRPA